jgi:hypothetical protein
VPRLQLMLNQATVLLNANVGFLAINSVDAGGRSPIQVASYMSLVSSLGSMILGLLLVSHNRTIGQLGTILQTVSNYNNDHNDSHGKLFRKFFYQDLARKNADLKGWP